MIVQFPPPPAISAEDHERMSLILDYAAELDRGWEAMLLESRTRRWQVRKLSGRPGDGENGFGGSNIHYLNGGRRRVGNNL